ncbi:4Fe-4S binding protein [Fulvivirga sedimenti]|uniref:4Fe-4S binding protein n=1 Tax=Fulvivirga sedimenti TaxID=2879465 RepID=A0A9X1KWN7_9BACT|nr:4Fe-4S binding protein [Fulvivirga sedimenti]MCA6074134.1 4Fe-4S binding protein [Fulvivirga sedimenti]
MTAIQKIGITFFITACVLTIGVLFVNSYKLSDEVIDEAISGETERDQLKNILNPLYGTPYSTSFTFQNAYGERLSAANDEITKKYAISDSEIARYLTSAGEEPITYRADMWDAVFEDNEAGDFKRDQFKSYTSWMENKVYATSGDLRNQLSITQNDINSRISESKGFGGERLKSINLALNRHGSTGTLQEYRLPWLLGTIGLGILGALMYILPKSRQLPGIKNNGIFRHPNTNRGWIGIIVGTLLILFYIVLYWYPEHMTGWMILVDPLSLRLNGGIASQWFFYGLLYTLSILVMGIRMMIKYRHSKYHLVRTGSVMFFQTAFAFLIPEILIRLNMPSMDLKNIWPLNYTFFYDYNLQQLTSAGVVGTSMLIWGILLIVIGVPLLTYLYGKRWYCSWVCGCGGLAETLGDPYRQLSDKSVKAWKIERWMIHSVLVFAILMTAGVVYTYFSGSSTLLGINTYSLRSVYGFLIGAAFAGVVGVGFYPFMGNRVWCRFGCPLAAYLGIVQRFKSRFRITTNGGQCISCGNCSTYCEMGIDVRWYAQRGQNIVRSSCVGCGVCSSVCPRGVLNLENRDENGRFGTPELTGLEPASLPEIGKR